MKKRKILISLGTVSAIVAPIAAVISCGTNVVGGAAFTKKNNLVELNFNNPPGKGEGGKYKFEPYFPGNVISQKSLTSLYNDINGAMSAKNTLKIKDGEKIKIDATYFYEKTTDDSDYASGKKVTEPKDTVRFEFIYHPKLDSGYDKFKLLPYGFENNIVTELLNQMNANKWIADSDLALIKNDQFTKTVDDKEVKITFTVPKKE